jgi:predicted NBD/HSP70 family sugar kinase
VVRPRGPGLPAEVLAHVLRYGPRARSDLRRGIGTSLSTVTGAVQDLLTAGLLVESGRALSTGGRPPELLDLAPDLGGVLAIDIGAINVRAAAADCRGTVMFRETWSMPEPSYKKLRPLILRLSEKARTHLTGPVRAVGVAVAGIVHPESGRVTHVDNIAGWPESTDLSWLDRFDAPLLIDNEANLAALGEHQAGVGAGMPNMLFVALGGGVGAGLIMNNALYRGSSGVAGEMGLFRSDHGPTPILERRVAPAAVMAAYTARTGIRVSAMEEMFDRAAANDAAARDAVAGMITQLSVAIANAILLCDPSMVVIGGGLGGAGEALLAPLREHVERLVPVVPRIVPSELGAEAAVIGAVRWAAQVAEQGLMAEVDGGLARA